MLKITTIRSLIKCFGGSVLRSKPQNLNSLKTITYPKSGKTFNLLSLENKNPDIAYHGSPFSFNFFDPKKIGTGEGINKFGRGLYISREKRLTPFYANIRSKDAPVHLGSTKPLKNPNPNIYTLSNIKSLNLKKVSSLEAKNICKTQNTFEINNPGIDGLELENQICVFPKSLSKLNILKKQNLNNFVNEHKGYPFREWTTNILA